jgi:hypothetical protein
MPRDVTCAGVVSRVLWHWRGWVYVGGATMLAWVVVVLAVFVGGGSHVPGRVGTMLAGIGSMLAGIGTILPALAVLSAPEVVVPVANERAGAGCGGGLFGNRSEE